MQAIIDDEVTKRFSAEGLYQIDLVVLKHVEMEDWQLS